MSTSTPDDTHTHAVNAQRTRTRRGGLPNRNIAFVPAAIVAAVALCPAASPLPSAGLCDGYPPASTPGRHDVVIDSFVQPDWPDGHLYVLRPKGLPGPLPVVAYLPGLGALYPKTNADILRYTASHGYAIVYCPSEPFHTVKEQTFAVESAIACMRTAFDSLGTVLDTTRICFAGHSQGAGVVPAVAFRCIRQHGWARERALLYVMAPWYLFGITSRQLEGFPPHAFLFVQTYADDAVNDHRIARHLYRTIGIPARHKRYMLIGAGSRTADEPPIGHSIPSTETRDQQDDDHHAECCAVYPVFGTVLGDVLRNDISGARVFGDSLPALLSGPCRTSFVVIDRPRILHPQERYLNFWTHRLNPHMTFRSLVGMSEPWKYASRVTIRNYRKAGDDAETRCGELRPWPYELPEDTAAPDGAAPYGRPGPYDAVYTSFAHCGWGTGTHHLYMPRDTVSSPPLIILLHDLASAGPRTYQALIAHLVSRGNAVMHLSYDLPFRRLAPDARRYHVLLNAVHNTLDIYAHRVDSTRVGIVGFGYGAGAAPSVAQHVFGRRNLGGNGAFVYAVVPTEPRFAPIPRLNDLPGHLLTLVELPHRAREGALRRIRRVFGALGANGGARIDYCCTDPHECCGANRRFRAAALAAAAFTEDAAAYRAATLTCTDCAGISERESPVR